MRGGSIESVLHIYELLQETLYEIQEGHDEYAAKAHGILIYILGLILPYLYFLQQNNFPYLICRLSRKQPMVQLYLLLFEN